MSYNETAQFISASFLNLLYSIESCSKPKKKRWHQFISVSTNKGHQPSHTYLGAWLERPPIKRRRLIPEPCCAEKRVGAEHALAHLLKVVGIPLLEPHPPDPPKQQEQRRHQ